MPREPAARRSKSTQAPSAPQSGRAGLRMRAVPRARVAVKGVFGRWIVTWRRALDRCGPRAGRGCLHENRRRPNYWKGAAGPCFGVAVASSSDVVGRLKVVVRRGAILLVARRPRVGVVCSFMFDRGRTKGRGFTHGDRTKEGGRRWTCGTSRESRPSSSLAFRSRTIE